MKYNTVAKIACIGALIGGAFLWNQRNNNRFEDLESNLIQSSRTTSVQAYDENNKPYDLDNDGRKGDLILGNGRGVKQPIFRQKDGNYLTGEQISRNAKDLVKDAEDNANSVAEQYQGIEKNLNNPNTKPSKLEEKAETKELTSKTSELRPLPRIQEEPRFKEPVVRTPYEQTEPVPQYTEPQPQLTPSPLEINPPKHNNAGWESLPSVLVKPESQRIELPGHKPFPNSSAQHLTPEPQIQSPNTSPVPPAPMAERWQEVRPTIPEPPIHQEILPVIPHPSKPTKPTCSPIPRNCTRNQIPGLTISREAVYEYKDGVPGLSIVTPGFFCQPHEVPLTLPIARKEFVGFTFPEVNLSETQLRQKGCAQCHNIRDR
ncbi:hypothetical protein HOD75_01320 [archaeon]|jgi:hypothetical protein|nr:hypothetical protein [archaeon]MBT4241518.1 hypothetical protein [archaeon]MBT4417611.1 hypothetical protein [archaeon]